MLGAVCLSFSGEAPKKVFAAPCIPLFALSRPAHPPPERVPFLITCLSFLTARHCCIANFLRGLDWNTATLKTKFLAQPAAASADSPRVSSGNHTPTAATASARSLISTQTTGGLLSPQHGKHEQRKCSLCDLDLSDCRLSSVARGRRKHASPFHRPPANCLPRSRVNTQHSLITTRSHTTRSTHKHQHCLSCQIPEYA